MQTRSIIIGTVVLIALLIMGKNGKGNEADFQDVFSLFSDAIIDARGGSYPSQDYIPIEVKKSGGSQQDEFAVHHQPRFREGMPRW